MTGCDPNLESFHKSDMMKHAGNNKMSGYASVSTQISLTPDSCVFAPCYTDLREITNLVMLLVGLKLLNKNFTVLP